MSTPEPPEEIVDAEFTENNPDDYYLVRKDEVFELPAEPKPGVKTTEFWATILSHLAAIVAAVTVVTQADATAVVEQIVVIIGALGLIWRTTETYIRSRTALKSPNSK